MPPKAKAKRVYREADEADKKFEVRGRAVAGDGSVYPVRDKLADSTVRERWKATYRDASGKLRTVSGPTKTAVQERREQAKAKAATEAKLNPSSFSTDTTVAQLAAWWLTNVAAHRVRPSSYGRYVDRVRRITETIGDIPVMKLRAEQVAAWQTELLKVLAHKTVADTRVVLRQVLEVAVGYELVPANAVDRVAAPKANVRATKALTAEQARALIKASADDRLGAVVALLFVQGWRVSEVLGLAWGDVDLEHGTATVRRAAVYVDGRGVTLGPPKTSGVQGVHILAPGVVASLKARKVVQEAERAVAGEWATHTYDGAAVDLVFTNTTGGIVQRTHVSKMLKRYAERIGIDPEMVSTHTGRRTVVTALYGSEGVDLADIARHVGHASPTTTAGYVKELGERPKRTAEAAARMLDLG